MAKHYRVIGSATGLEPGAIVTDGQLEKDHAGLGGAARLLELKAIEEVSATEAKKAEQADPRSPALTTGDTADKVNGPKADAQKQAQTAAPAKK